MILGTDPEAFLTLNNRVIPAHRARVPSKKKEVKRANGTFSRDGWAVEVRPGPDPCRATLWSRTRRLFEEIQKRAAKSLKVEIGEVGFSLVPVADLTQRQRMAAPNWPKDVGQFGCEPAFDAWEGGQPIVNTIDAMTHPHRYVGGHMHFQLTDYIGFPGLFRVLGGGDVEKARKLVSPLVQLLDSTVGLAFTVLYPGRDEAFRRNFYGKAGEFRVQNYGKSCTDCGFRCSILEMTQEEFVHSELKFYKNLSTPSRGEFRELMVKYRAHKSVNVWGLEYRTPSARLLKSVEGWSLFYLLGRVVLKDWKKYLDDLKHFKELTKVREVIQGADRDGAFELLTEFGRSSGLLSRKELGRLIKLGRFLDSVPDTYDPVDKVDPEVWGWSYYTSTGVSWKESQGQWSGKESLGIAA